MFLPLALALLWPGAMSAPCLDIVLNLVILVSYILNDAVRLRTHLFAQFYVAWLCLRSCLVCSQSGTCTMNESLYILDDFGCLYSNHPNYIHLPFRCTYRSIQPLLPRLLLPEQNRAACAACHVCMVAEPQDP